MHPIVFINTNTTKNKTSLADAVMLVITVCCIQSHWNHIWLAEHSGLAPSHPRWLHLSHPITLFEVKWPKPYGLKPFTYWFLKNAFTQHQILLIQVSTNQTCNQYPGGKARWRFQEKKVKHGDVQSLSALLCGLSFLMMDQTEQYQWRPQGQ